MGFMHTESVLQSKNRSGPAKNRFSVALNACNNVQLIELWIFFLVCDCCFSR